MLYGVKLFKQNTTILLLSNIYIKYISCPTWQNPDEITIPTGTQIVVLQPMIDYDAYSIMIKSDYDQNYDFEKNIALVLKNYKK